MIRLIVSDIDKTLLKDGEKSLEKRVIECVRQLYDNKIIFMVASGRPYTDIYTMFEEVTDKMVIVSCDGAMMADGDMIIVNPMNRSKSLSIIKAANELDMPVCVTSQTTTYLKRDNPEFYHMIDKNRNEKITVIDDFSDIREKFLKINIYNVKQDINKQNKVVTRAKDDFNVVYRSNEWIELVAKGIDKGYALRQYMMMNNIDASEVMAFGDNCNDISMLKIAKESYGVLNATEDVKSIVNYLTDDVIDTIKARVL
mgnify:FL=1